MSLSPLVQAEVPGGEFSGNPERFRMTPAPSVGFALSKREIARFTPPGFPRFTRDIKPRRVDF
jgi:hypothetical protein